MTSLLFFLGHSVSPRFSIVLVNVEITPAKGGPLIVNDADVVKE